jgi:hypothetical protein
MQLLQQWDNAIMPCLKHLHSKQVQQAVRSDW